MTSHFPSLWRVLADPTRRRLIELLRDGPRTTGDLCRAFPTSRFAVMKHLRVLERAGLLAVRREGRSRWNALNPEVLQQLDGRLPGAVPAPAGIRQNGDSMPAEQREPARESAPLQVFVDGVPWKVFDALTMNVAAWWGGRHMRSAEASNLVLEPQPGGRFYEEWGHRQGALRGIVTAIRQDERLELRGALFDEAATARMSIRLESREGGTLLTLSGERLPADAIDDLFRVRLKAFVEKGVRSGVSG